MDIERAIRERRTTKAFGADPVDSETLAELFELARWAPSHHLTFPWRFRVLGPASLAALKAAAGAEAAGKLDRAPTLVVASVLRSDGDPVQEEEDMLAAGVAVYIVLLAATARGLANYWRTPEVLRRDDGLRAIGIDPAAERAIGLIHLGPARQEQSPPERPAIDDFVTHLD
jgi:nitroreductase